MPIAKTQDGCEINFEVYGAASAPALIVGYPWCTGWAKMQQSMFGGNQAALDAMLQMNSQVIDTLATKFKVLHIDYPRGCAPTTGPFEGDLSAETVTSDYLAIADAAGVDKFVAVGYSWSASFGIQVASRTPRCAGAAVGAWPVLDAPHEQLKAIVEASAKAAPAGSPMSKIMISNSNYYDSIISNWDQELALVSLKEKAGFLYLFVGGNDRGVPGMAVPIAERIVETRERLERTGWKVDVLEGHDHIALAMDSSRWLGRFMNHFENKTW